MKLFIMSDAGNVHTQRWVTSLAARGAEIMLFSLSDAGMNFYDDVPNVKCLSFSYNSIAKRQCGGNSLSKLRYLNTVSFIKKAINNFAPDIVHAHFASSYGLLGALAGKHPYVVSVWGSDVYYFPRISPLHKLILKYNLAKADVVLSTSNVMAEETKRYTCKEPDITPFGVDVEKFRPMDGGQRVDGELVVGTVKALRKVYGVDVLIRAFAKVRVMLQGRRMKLVIAGEGEEIENLMALCEELNVSADVDFVGRIPNAEVPGFISRMDVFVALSHNESFGVAAVEAMACEVPVVVSDADGFCEVVPDGVTGYVVPRGDDAAAAEKIAHLLLNPDLATKMGRKAREHVVVNYSWSASVDKMMQVYDRILSKNNR